MVYVRVFNKFFVIVTGLQRVVRVNAPTNVSVTAQNGTTLLAIIWFKNGVIT